MKIYSMTGFGRAEKSDSDFTVTIEIKTVNNRFKDFRFKIPGQFNVIEKKLKDILDENFKRGSFDLYLNVKKAAQENTDFDLDDNKIEQFIAAFKKRHPSVADRLSINPTDFFRREFSVEDDEEKEKKLHPLIFSTMQAACSEVLQSRKEEGKKLVQVLNSHLDIYRDYYKKVQKLKAGYEESIRERILKKFEENKELVKVEETRFHQEIIYYLEKLDIEEEINRIDSHLKKIDKVLSGDGEVGRQLDFLLQELNRETNTIGSKSGNVEISDSVIQMKVQLEKIREQALNLE
ncbi:MAG: YicC family protein [Bacteriovoracaceae bacterium]|nr:YicC family protein [Bacteriovoracaceae bacterium]